MTVAPAGTIRFCTIADSSHFVGVVALVNSLRLHGHDDPVTVLDLGLTAPQRNELAGHCELVAPPDGWRHPWLVAPHACLARPAEVVVYLDADVIVTAPLDDLIGAARDGRFCAFPDRMPDRWFAEWEDALSLPSPPRHQPYLNTGLLVCSTRAFAGLLHEWAARCDAVELVPATTPPIDFDDPLALADQDVLNALLMTIVEPEQLEALPSARAPHGGRQLAHTRIDDLGTLACSFDGTRTTLLHAFGSPKPWQAQERYALRRTAYLRCLRRLLVGEDLAVRSRLPRVPWLEPGVRGEVTMHLCTVRTAARSWLRARLKRA